MEVVMIFLRYHLPGGTEENPQQNSQRLDKDLNWAPPCISLECYCFSDLLSVYFKYSRFVSAISHVL